MDTTAQFTLADVAYVEANFTCLQTRPPDGPGPAYVLDDGREFYPHDYAELPINEGEFKRRLAAACAAEGMPALDAHETWLTYMEGTYGVCLHSATPENIGRKNALLQRIERLAAEPGERRAAWSRELKEAVDALDALERPFSPHYDRVRFGRPPTRDSHIAGVRARFPEIAE